MLGGNLGSLLYGDISVMLVAVSVWHKCQSIYFSLFLDTAFSIVNRFSKILQHILGQTISKIQQKIFLQLNEIEDIRKFHYQGVQITH